MLEMMTRGYTDTDTIRCDSYWRVRTRQLVNQHRREVGLRFHPEDLYVML